MTYADVEDPAAALSAAAEDRPGRQSTKELIEKAGWKIQGVNWIYEQVTGENLLDALIKPLLGDFEKIDANAHAWNQVGKALDSVRRNLDGGADQLGQHWEGDAAASFRRRMDTMWAIAIEADSQVARIIGDRFKSMANTCRTACGLALTLLDKLVGKLMEAIMTAAIPVVGWGRAVWMVYDAIELADAIRKIIISIQTLIEGVQGMVDGIVAMGTALMKLKDVRDVNDLLDVVDGYQEGQEKYNDGKAAVKSGAIGVGMSAWGIRGKYNNVANGRPAPTAPAPPPPPAPAPPPAPPAGATTGARP
ncbi:WXG100 family type VII secretion target [Actinokineospora fastidiosa]|uniref:WXG100 family type VII secretion target n=1 Tax=Actinokineospora fastidiosa TaxID=1816 RepID=A0A918GA44_9PSEU|nr:hypothetical protein [Actinokineospora fastidiosa]GGS23057.1 hypothetical protein GCM10010171_14990 [Actinokineospora fastidiosa]